MTSESFNVFGMNHYQDEVMKMPLYDDPLIGLVGEVGEVTEIIKKDRREATRRQPVNREDLVKELGDVLWYLTRLAGENKISLREVAEINLEKLTERHKN